MWLVKGHPAQALPHVLPTTASQQFAGMSVNSAPDPCFWLVLQRCRWGIAVSTYKSLGVAL